MLGLSDDVERAYISGPMTGLPNHNFKAFNVLAAKLREQGYVVYNPAENFGGFVSHERCEFMRIDLTHLLQVDALVLLPGWSMSEGARLELLLAQELDLEIVCAEGTKPLLVVTETRNSAVEEEVCANS